MNRSLEKLEELTHPGALKQAIRFALHGQGRGIGDSFVMLFAGIETLLNLFVNGVESDERFISTHGLVNFRGQVGTAQMRNAGGVRYTDGFLVLAALVDTSGYGSGIKEKYQAYLITDVAIELGGQTLKPGAYGCGFIDNNKFAVMDLGANDLFQVTSTKDAEIKRPIPLQFVATSESGKYRLYHGRDFVEFRRVK